MYYEQLREVGFHIHVPAFSSTAVALSKNTNLTELRLPGCNIDSTGLFLLASALGGTDTLTVLDLSGNDGIGSQGVKHLGK